MSTSQTAIYDAWVKEALDVDPSRYARQSSGLPSGKASSGPDLMLEVTSAQDTLEQQLAFYHTTKTGAQSTADLTGNVDDPGPKIDKAAAEAHKDAAAAIASIKGRDPAKAAKLISAIKDRVKEISGLATNYATAVDKANAAGAAKIKSPCTICRRTRILHHLQSVPISTLANAARSPALIAIKVRCLHRSSQTPNLSTKDHTRQQRPAITIPISGP